MLARVTLARTVGQVARELSTTLRDPQVMQGLKDLGTGIGDVIKGGVAFAKTVWSKNDEYLAKYYELYGV